MEGASVRVSVSVGIALGPRNLLSEADMALRSAKHGQSHHAFYDPELGMTERYRENIRRLARIRSALEADGFIPYFQPILRVSDETVGKYECLARLRDAEGTAMPVEFLDLSRRAKLYPEISRRVIAKSFARFAGSDYEFSVNVALDDILNPETVAFIIEQIDRADAGRNLIVELLETERMADSPAVFGFIDSLRSRGCRIAMDDFGAGYSNFDFLLRVRPDFLKIDASLVRRMADDAGALLAVKAIVDLSKTLGMETVAEHVHDRRVFGLVRELGVDYAQGFLIGIPSPTPAPGGTGAVAL